MAAAEQTDLCRDSWVLEQVRYCIEHKLNSTLLIDPASELVIAGAEGRYIKRLARTVKSKWSLSKGKGHFCRRHSALSDSDPVLERTRQDGRPLNELLWDYAWRWSDGRLLPDCRRDDVAKLTRWPNLTRVSSSANSMRIAALLTARPTSLVLASRILNVEEKELFQFYSAARYAGLTDSVNRDARVVSMTQGSRRNLGMIRRLLKHLEGLRNQRQNQNLSSV